MKRKLNSHDVPEETSRDTEVDLAPQLQHLSHDPQQPRKPNGAHSIPDSAVQFQSLGLDARLLQAVERKKWSSPTQVQAKAIPLALEGRDLLGNIELSICENFLLTTPST